MAATGTILFYLQPTRAPMAQLYFYYSAMNAGKSTSLLQSAHNYREQGMNVLMFTAAIDDRFGSNSISSRIGLTEPALTFSNTTDLLADISAATRQKTISCVLLDEAQFLTRAQVDQLSQVVDEFHIPVLCYGIRTDFRGELFAGSQRLLAIADKLKELKTVCQCGKKATMVVRLDADGKPMQQGEQVEIGGNERYESKCRKHFYDLVGYSNEPS